jgi:hypothetical protein
MKPTCLIACLVTSSALMLGAATASAADTSAVEHIKECSRANVPEPGSLRAVRFVKRDRIGHTRVTRLRMEGKRTEDGSRRILAVVIEPDEMKDAMLLIIERDGENEIYFKTPEMPTPKKINAADQSLSMFGTDFTYEDIQNLQRFNRPGVSKRLADDRVGGRPVWVVETLPEADSGSGYRSIVTSIDKATCMPLQIKMYGDGTRVRKILNVDPNQIAKRGDTWIAHHVIMKDMRDYTETQMLVDSADVHVDFPDDHFRLESLRKTSAPSSD